MSMVTFAAYLDGQTFMDYVALPSVNMIVNMETAPDLTLVLVKLDGQVQIARSAYAYLVATTDTVICRSNVDVDLDGQECFVISVSFFGCCLAPRLYIICTSAMLNCKF